MVDMDEDNVVSIGSDNTEKDEKDGYYVDGADEDDVTDDASKKREPKSNKKKRPLSLAGNKKKVKVHPAVELLKNLSSAVEKQHLIKLMPKHLRCRLKSKGWLLPMLEQRQRLS